MTQLKNMIGSFIIMYALIFLITNAWTGFSDGYDIEEENLQDNKNVFERLRDVNLISGIKGLRESIGTLTTIKNGGDLIGGLAIGAQSTLQIIGGIVTFPIELTIALGGFYDAIIPPILTQIIGFLSVVTLGVILISAKLGFSL